MNLEKSLYLSLFLSFKLRLAVGIGTVLLTLPIVWLVVGTPAELKDLRFNLDIASVSLMMLPIIGAILCLPIPATLVIKTVALLLVGLCGITLSQSSSPFSYSSIKLLLWGGASCTVLFLPLSKWLADPSLMDNSSAKQRVPTEVMATTSDLGFMTVFTNPDCSWNKLIGVADGYVVFGKPKADELPKVIEALRSHRAVSDKVTTIEFSDITEISYFEGADLGIHYRGADGKIKASYYEGVDEQVPECFQILKHKIGDTFVSQRMIWTPAQAIVWPAALSLVLGGAVFGSYKLLHDVTLGPIACRQLVLFIGGALVLLSLFWGLKRYKSPPVKLALLSV